jgi:hypothetical protein
MPTLLRRSAAARLDLLAGGLALAGIAAITLLAGAWLGLPGDAPADPAERLGGRQEEAERLALTMLAVGVGAVSCLAGLAALALERSVLTPERSVLTPERISPVPERTSPVPGATAGAARHPLAPWWREPAPGEIGRRDLVWRSPRSIARRPPIAAARHLEPADRG